MAHSLSEEVDGSSLQLGHSVALASWQVDLELEGSAVRGEMPEERIPDPVFRLCDGNDFEDNDRGRTGMEDRFFAG